MSKIFITGELPDKYIREFLQHIRDFDAAHGGCELQMWFTTDLPGAEIEAMLKSISPPLPFQVHIKKE